VTRAGAELIRQAEHVELLVDPELSVLVFERVGWTDADYARWSGRLLEEQIGFVTPSKHAGRVCCRFAIVNPLTTIDDLALLLDSMH
jgi:glutamate/tyrosine decarboxylase-like PLP-dependent enzyme